MAVTEQTTRTAAFCWHCDRMVDTATAMLEPATPSEGDVSLCLYCGAVGVFDSALVLCRPTKELLDDLADNKDFRLQYAKFSWARQYVMLQRSLMHEDQGPDR